MKTLFLALRNLARNRDRSIAALLTTMIGAIAILLFGGFIRFVGYGLQTGYVQYGGHFQIQRYGYSAYGSGNPAAFGIANYLAIIAQLKTDPQLGPMIQQVTPTIEMTGIIGNSNLGTSRSVIARGVVVDEQNSLRQWNQYDLSSARDNQLALTGSAENEIVIGRGVARVLRLCEELGVSGCPSLKNELVPGDGVLPPDLQSLSEQQDIAPVVPGHGHARVQLLAATIQGVPNVAELNVVKAEAQGTKEFDDVFVILHLDQAQRLLFGHETPQVTSITVQLKNTALMPAARARIEEIFHMRDSTPSLEINNFQSIFPFYDQALRMFDVIFGFISVLIGTVVIFTVGNAIRMAVLDRTVEIGTLRAIGFTRAEIRKLFVYEGFILGVIGTILGTLFAVVVALLVNRIGINWLPPGLAKPVIVTVLIWGEATLILYTCAALIAAAGSSAWWAARSASGKNIVDSLRHV